MIRLGKVINLNDDGEVEFTYLDGLGGNITNYVSMPYVGLNSGILVKPAEGDVIIVDDNSTFQRCLMLGYIPQNYSKLPGSLKSGEYLFINKARAMIYMTQNGSIYVMDNAGNKIVLDSKSGKMVLNGIKLEGVFGDFDVYSGDIVRLNATYEETEFSFINEGLIEVYVSKKVRDKSGGEVNVDEIVYLYIKIGDNFQLYIDEKGTIKIDGNRFILNMEEQNEINGNMKINGDIEINGDVSIGDIVKKLIKSSFIDIFNSHVHAISGSNTLAPTTPAVKTVYETNKLESE